MALYLIGDVQGCDRELGQLLELLAFSPSRDRLVVLGDLVNRGPDSAAVLRRLATLDTAVTCLLGNHDLHLLAVAAGVRPLRRGDTVQDVLQAGDRDALLGWLRQQRLAWFEQDCLMVHAGVPPGWTVEQTLGLAAEVEAVLRSPQCDDWLPQMYGDRPHAWRDNLAGADRLRVVVNALTRMRFCTDAGRMEFDGKGGPDTAPVGYLPWFEHAHRKTASTRVAFGHWSTLGLLDRPNLICLDTGCAWGGQLSAMRLGPGAMQRELIQVPCGASRP
jgi:bis(5'-nucleosyl)-tetraphosphatase (symmetrical)